MQFYHDYGARPFPFFCRLAAEKATVIGLQNRFISASLGKWSFSSSQTLEVSLPFLNQPLSVGSRTPVLQLVNMASQTSTRTLISITYYCRARASFHNIALTCISHPSLGWLGVGCPRLGSGGWFCFMLWVQPKLAPHSERMAQGCSMYAHSGIQTCGSGHLEVLLGSPSSSPWWHRGTKRWTVTLLLCPMFYWPEPSPRADAKVKIGGAVGGAAELHGKWHEY